MLKTFITPQLSPIILYLLFYISGILLTDYIFSLTLSLVFIIPLIIFLTCFIIILLIRKCSTAYFLLCLAGGIIRTGFTLHTYTTYQPSAQPLLKVKDIFNTGNNNWPFGTVFVQTHSHKTYNVLLYTKKRPFYTIDDICTSKVVFKNPSYNSFCHYLLKENIAATAFVPVFSADMVSSTPHSLRSYLHRKRYSILNSISSHCSIFTAALFTSLCLGNKKIFKNQLRPIKLHFRSWGIAHHLARSGLHLLIVLAIWYMILSFIPLPYGIKTILISLISFVFSLFSFDSISFTRSLFIFFITQFLAYSNYQIHKLYLVCLIAFIFLLFNPFLIFGLDFQLSFFITFLLCLLSLINRQKRVIYCKLLLNDYKKS